MSKNQRRLLEELFEASVKAADPLHCLSPFLPEKPVGRTLVIGAGKAAASMAKAVENAWEGEIEGLVVTRYDHGLELDHIEVIEAAHPVPDGAGMEAARRIYDLASSAGEGDLVLCLMSGGASALLSLPGGSLELADKQSINKALLKSGANITEMNCVRKHLSAIKGGRLALAAYPAKVITLGISDIPGDDPATIGSGPSLGDETSVQEAIAILQKYNIDVPEQVSAHLASAAAETPSPDDDRLAENTFHMIATPQISLVAAAELAKSKNITPIILGDSIEGEAREVAIVMAGIARQVANHHQPAAPPCVLLSGGETTVTVKGSGRGGRNAEFLLSLVNELKGISGIYALACDTDGIDGSENNAGAYCGPETYHRAHEIAVDIAAHLDRNDGYGFFEAVEGLIFTGPTRTNVNDFRAILIE